MPVFSTKDGYRGEFKQTACQYLFHAHGSVRLVVGLLDSAVNI